jgi:glycosyltransferase involved in cell wall biosynthesis
MKLLIITQKVDDHDDVLGFFVRWIEEFAKYAEKVTVICLQKGTYHLPDNVKVLSLGKEERKGRMIYIVRFFSAIWKKRREYDTVFVHMNPIYILFGGLFWKLWSKKIALWYTHKQVDLKLRIAEKFTDIVFTASKKSFRLKSDKVLVVGHGIDIERFYPVEKKSHKKLNIISVSRIAPVKNIHLMIEVAEILKKEDIPFEIKIAGAPITDADKIYFAELEKKVRDKNLHDSVIFVGAIPYSDIPAFYQKSDLFINLSETGSLDKAVLEAMASGVNVLTSNEAFFEMLPQHNVLRDLRAQSLTEHVRFFIKNKADPTMLREIIAKNHDMSVLIKNIYTKIE